MRLHMLPWVASRRKALPYRHVINILIDSGKFNTHTHAHMYTPKRFNYDA